MGESARQIEITESIIKFRKFLLVLVWITPLVGLIVLLMIQFLFPPTLGQTLSFHSDLVIYLLAICLGVIGYVHFRMLPKARRIKEPYFRFNIHLKAVMVTVNFVGFSGLFLGLLTLLLERVIPNLFEIGSFFVLSIGYGIFLLKFEILPTFHSYEIGKEILVKS